MGCCKLCVAGMQSGVLVGAVAAALPLSFKLMPEYLNDLGYRSVMVGKWHLGCSRAVYTPTSRGFNSHVGYWTGHEDYYDHTSEEIYGNGEHYVVRTWNSLIYIQTRLKRSIAAFPCENGHFLKVVPEKMAVHSFWKMVVFVGIRCSTTIIFQLLELF